MEEIFDLIKNDPHKKTSIGTNKERSIHQFLKYYLCHDSSFHEIKLNDKIVDIFLDNQVFEIQTQAFNNLVDKLKVLLPLYPVTIVYPVINNKTLYQVNELGVFQKTKLSPKHEHPLQICSELYKIKPFLSNPNLSLLIVEMDCDAYLSKRINKRKQIRNTPLDYQPTKINNVIKINNMQELKQLLPPLELFDRATFSKKTKLSGRNLSGALVVLKDLDIITIDHKEGKKYIYKCK